MNKMIKKEKECLKDLIRNTPDYDQGEACRLAIMSPSMEQVGLIEYNTETNCKLVGEDCPPPLSETLCEDCDHNKISIKINRIETFNIAQDGFSVYYEPNEPGRYRETFGVYKLFYKRTLIHRSPCPFNPTMDRNLLYGDYLKLTFVR